VADALYRQPGPGFDPSPICFPTGAQPRAHRHRRVPDSHQPVNTPSTNHMRTIGPQSAKSLLDCSLDFSKIRSTVYPEKVAVSPLDRPEGNGGAPSCNAQFAALRLFPNADSAACLIHHGSASTPEEVGANARRSPCSK
jgi:hypothetical protein